MLEHVISPRGDGGCLVRLSGTVEATAACELLDQLWEDALYGGADYAIWDVGACELPAIETVLRISDYTVRNKAGRGPDILVFVSPAFGQKLVTRVYHGFERVLSLKLNFLTTIELAQSWIAKHHQAAAD